MGVLWILLATCSGQASPPTSATTPTLGAAIFHTDGGDVRVQVEIAATEQQRRKGLMHRQRLEADHGMYFVFPSERVRTFWMRNTLLSLDMIFIGANRRVVGIVDSADPLTDEPRGVRVPSIYVVEVVAGYAKARGIRVGTHASFENLPLQARR